MKDGKNTIIKKAAVILIWLFLWEAAARLLNNSLALPAPIDTGKALVRLMTEPAFIRTVLFSAGRIAGGFGLALFFGIFLAALSCRYSFIGLFLEPAVRFLKAVPVAAVVILILIWMGSKALTFAVVFAVVFPVIYLSVRQGIGQTDPSLLEMAASFHVPAFRKIWYLYRPAVMPPLIASCRAALGMSWKSGIAAEVIGLPLHSIGEQLYMAKIYFSTDELFAWVLVILAASFLFEQLVLWLLEKLTRPMEWVLNPGHRTKKEDAVSSGTFLAEGSLQRTERTSAAFVLSGQALTGTDICCRFGETEVLSHVSFHWEAGGIYCLMGRSGRGKTTLLRIVSGLAKAQAGTINEEKPEAFAEKHRFSLQFQEDRLLPQLSGRANMYLTCPTFDGTLLSKEEWDRNVTEYSGGMKRRASLTRAISWPGEVILLDEPFTGLDEETKKQAMKYILRNRRGRTCIFTSHDREDAKGMGAKIVEME